MPAEFSTVEYNTSGQIISTINALSFGAITPAYSGSTRIIRLQSKHSITRFISLKLGIVGATIQGFPISQVYTIGHNEFFDPSFVPTEFFPDVNTTNTVEDVNNVAVGLSLDLKGSDYVYLSSHLPSRYLGSGECVYRWFFTYED